MRVGSNKILRHRKYPRSRTLPPTEAKGRCSMLIPPPDASPGDGDEATSPAPPTGGGRAKQKPPAGSRFDGSLLAVV